MELGRDVAAVPGPIDVPQSAGTNGCFATARSLIAESPTRSRSWACSRPRAVSRGADRCDAAGDLASARFARAGSRHARHARVRFRRDNASPR